MRQSDSGDIPAEYLRIVGTQPTIDDLPTVEPRAPRTRRDHLRYYARAAFGGTRRHYGWRRAAKHFWSARWWWSGGLMGPQPSGYGKDAWR